MDTTPVTGDEPDGDPSSRSFADLGLESVLVDTLTALGYEEPTPIQQEAIPALLAGRDLQGQAATGTGKTAAFALPILQRLDPPVERGQAPAALVLVPTRELAVQVSEAVHRYGRGVGARVVPIYGGQPIARQLRALAAGVDVVVATPGRVLDHLQRRSLVLDSVRTVVLDEADEMLDMGFADDIESILDTLPDPRQTVLFSATLPRHIQSIARRHLHDAINIEMGHAAAAGEAPAVRQTAYLVRRPHKPSALGRILDVESPTAALVFCRTRAEVDALTETLNGRGYRAEALHGGMDQVQRDKVMGRLRAGTADLIVATDVAARGIDVEQLTHVVNYDVPSAPDAYIHRIGRVGRAGREGAAITLTEPREHRMLKAIERVTGVRISVLQVPSAAEMRTHRLELTREALREILLSDDVDHARPVVETLGDEFDLMEIALAAVSMAHDSRGAVAGADEDIPAVSLDDARPARARSGRTRPEGSRGSDGRRPQRVTRATGDDMTRLFVSAGRSARIRPGDLVGAIANETSLSGSDIGAIDIQDKFSLVEVPAGKVDEVIDALRGTTLRGKRVNARRERY